MNVADALTATLAACTEHVRANVAGAKRGQDPESLHQLRVGIRRMRAGLSAYRDAMPPGERRNVGRALRQLDHDLGPARDWDVLIEKYGKAMQGRGRRRQDSAKLMETAKARRAEAHDRLVKLISRSPLTKLLQQVQHLAAGRGAELASGASIQDFAVQVLDTRDRRTRKMGRGIRSLRAEELHRLRISVKKLRYASEFFVGLWPKATTEGYVTALERLQDELGDMQDAESADKLIAGIRKEQQAALRHATRQAHQRVDASRKRARRRIVRRWRNFKAARRFWRRSTENRAQ